jgi:hypothetical protein
MSTLLIAKIVRARQLLGELAAAGIVAPVHSLSTKEDLADGLSSGGSIEHDGTATVAIQAVVTAHVPKDTPDKKIHAAAITNIINALEAGTATNAQVQNVLAKVLRYLRAEDF